MSTTFTPDTSASNQVRASTGRPVYSAKVIPLPGALAQPIIQRRGPGRPPKNVISLNRAHLIVRKRRAPGQLNAIKDELQQLDQRITINYSAAVSLFEEAHRTSGHEALQLREQATAHNQAYFEGLRRRRELLARLEARQ